MMIQMIQMIPGWRVRLSLLAVLVLAAGAGAQTTQPAATAPAVGPVGVTETSFFETLDLTEFAKIAVYREGRVKTFESFAREMMAFVTGPRSYRNRPATAMYLDLMLRPEVYTEAEFIYVKSRVIRQQIVEALRSSMDDEFKRLRAMGNMPAGFEMREAEVTAEMEVRLERFRKTGLIAQPMLMDPRVASLLARLETNLITSAKYVRMIDSALAVKNPDFLHNGLRVVPPATGGFEDQWLTLDELGLLADEGGDSALRTAVLQQWDAFTGSWRRGDAVGVNAAAAELVGLLPEFNPGLYPKKSKLELESWYFSMKNLTWVWVLYAFSIIPLVLHIVFRWRGARWLGLSLFTVAFLFHTVAVMLRWYVADRWPNSNMFEAITTSAWMGGCFALILEMWLRRTPMRSLFALGSGVASMFALMVPHFLPLEINAGISNRMPVLHDVWLYIHTNVIIFSYCLIFMASISAGLYLVYRLVKRDGGAGEYVRAWAVPDR